MALVLDFDGTITIEDTVDVLAQFAISTQRKRGRDLAETWEWIKARYYQDCAEYKASYPVPETQRTTIEAEFDFLGGMKGLELASIGRVEEAGLFDGIEASEFRAAGEQAVGQGTVHVRSGFAELADLATRSGWDLFVVSVNWSRPFIEGILSMFGADIHVISNEVVDDRITCSLLPADSEARVLTTSRDKRHVLDRLGLLSGTAATAYFGDSVTDLAGLTLTSGVVISSTGESSLLNTLERLGIMVRHVDGWDSGMAWARDFSEVIESGILSSLRT
jgi:thiamine phosphate phosphatase / amino-HMP aminohydrolase